jgi:hypothetical protein
MAGKLHIEQKFQMNQYDFQPAPRPAPSTIFGLMTPL